MARSAAKPWKLAPYPTLVGTAMTGALTSPATTEGRAPSMPAATMTTRADRRGSQWVINGTKHWITGGTVSKLHPVFARAHDEDGTELGIGGFLAVRDVTPGLGFGRREPTMGLRGIP